MNKTGPLAFLTTVAGFIFIFALFNIWDWGRGIERGILLLILLAYYFACRHFIWPHIQLSSSEHQKWTTAVSVLIGVTVIWSINFFLMGVRLSHKTNDGVADQHQCSVRAVQALQRGENPYSQSAYLDTAFYSYAVTMAESHRECTDFDPQEQLAQHAAYWKNPELKNSFSLIPPFKNKEGECGKYFQIFQSMMYAYGPALLFLYFPFIVFLGPAGILCAHLLAAIGLSTWLFTEGKKKSGSAFIAMGSLLIFLLPQHLRKDSLFLGHSDLIPVSWAIVGLILWLKKNKGGAAFFIGLSMASKTLPGILLAPLLLRDPKKSWPFLAVLIAFFSPFAFWDKLGMIGYLTHPFLRNGDSTSLIHFLSPTGGVIVKIICLAVSAVFFWRMWKRKWDSFASVDFVVVAIIMALLQSQQIHNNYWVWLMPLLTLAAVQSMGKETVINSGGRGFNIGARS